MAFAPSQRRCVMNGAVLIHCLGAGRLTRRNAAAKTINQSLPLALGKNSAEFPSVIASSTIRQKLLT